MEVIEKKYIVDERNKKIAVQIDIETFKKIEEILENCALVQLIKQNDSEETLNLPQAREFYQKQEKAV